MDYREFQKSQNFFTKGPSFRYTTRVPLDILIKYLKKHFNWTIFPQESHLKLAECFDLGKNVPEDHPYVDYLKTIVDEGKDRKKTIEQVIETRRRVFNSIKNQNVIYDPIEISIFNTMTLSVHGFHRIAYAYYLRKKDMLVSFLTLDRHLIELSLRLFSIYDEPAELYQPINTPFFELCSVQHAEAEEKAKAAVHAIKNKEVPVIDVGAHLGFYSRFLWDNGFKKVLSVDFDKNMFECQKYLEAIGFRKLDYCCSDIQSYLEKQHGKFTMIAMSVFHIYLREGTWMEKAMTEIIGPWIKNNVDTLVVEHEGVTDKQMCDFWKNFCGFTKGKIIYTAHKYGRITHVFEK